MSTAALEPLRRNARLVTRALSADLVQVSTPDGVLGHVRSEHGAHLALRGHDPRSAVVIGSYPTVGLALEALRQRGRSL